MTKNILFALLCLLSVEAFGQKEVYFGASNPENLKVQSLKGVELQVGYNLLSVFSPQRYYHQMPYYAGYFSEKRIAPKWTLSYSVGLFGSRLKVPENEMVYDSISNSYYGTYNPNPDYQIVYSLGLKAGIEPRWYWNYAKRAEIGKAQLNSGWFLALPLSYEYNLFSTYKTDFVPTYNYQSYGFMTLKPTIGYRQSISDNLFLEASLGYGVGLSLFRFNERFEVYTTSAFPEFKLKAAYTFK